MTTRAYATGSAFPEIAEGKLRLYSMRFCPFAHRARLVLAHKEIPHETVNINLANKPEWFLKRNPNGQVPVVEKDDSVVCESLIVAEYLDSVFPDPRLVFQLVPANPYRKARDDMIINDYANKFISNFYKIISSGGKDTTAIDTLKSQLEKLENTLTERNSVFFGGEKPAFVDLMIWPWQERFSVLTHYNADITLTNFHRLQKWREQMFNLPAVKACEWSGEDHVKFTELWQAGEPNMYDYGLSE